MNALPTLELHRDGVALLPLSGQTSSAIWVQVPESSKPLRLCTCDECKKSKKTCTSLKALGQGLRQLESAYPFGWQRAFESTLWYRVAKAIYAGSQLACADVRVQQVERNDGGSAIRVIDSRGDEIAQYLDSSPARVSFLERMGKAPEGDYVDRGRLLERLSLYQLTRDERKFYDAGMKSGRHSWEDSFWHRLAYHCVRSVGDLAEPETPASRAGTPGTFHPAIDRRTGDFTLTYRPTPDRPFVKFTVPRKRVRPVLELLAKVFPEQDDLAIHPVPLASIFRVTQDTEIDLEVRPMIRVLQQSGEARFFDRKDFERFRYGNLVYIRELGLLAELEDKAKGRKFKTPKRMKLERSQVASFLDDHLEALEDGALVLDEPLAGLEIWKSYDHLVIDGEIDGEADGGATNSFRVDVTYRFGDSTATLDDLLATQKRGLSYHELAEGWVDLGAPAFRNLSRLSRRQQGEGTERRVVLSAGELLRLQATAEQPLDVAQSHDRASVLRQLLDHRPPEPYDQPDGFISTLRPYQELGVDWLRFLASQQLGGLLCDDMGLGKTHQSMALMAYVTNRPGLEGTAPFLVICPTSVMSHWRDKLTSFAPGLEPRLYHGPDRRLPDSSSRRQVVITSYGVLRNDIQRLAEVSWAAAFFDEIQYLKNRNTVSYEAAARLPVAIKIGLTGTPIENQISELKNLFDLVLPGYLGSNEEFQERFARALERHAAGIEAPGRPDEPSRIDELRRLIAPFVLRRLKSSVLDELPDKIVDCRRCQLFDDQAVLYREALAQRGRKLTKELKDNSKPVPFMHVFALLNHLKQICNHPALAMGELDRHSTLESGKWEVYSEILRECLDSGLKVVVFSQYLGMLEIMARQLETDGIDHVRFTGQTPAAERGVLVDRFNTSDDCRVFLGSLKAGGTGIDLIGGSVVIHYDRWWNAAKEDQATDRVHRFGQKKAVQVFTLVTEGTLEEKIAAMIDAKRDLLDTVVQEDDPRLGKLFSRQELLELLTEV